MTSGEFLAVLSKAGISLALDGEALLVKGAKGSLDKEMTAYLMAHKAQLVGFLKSGIALDGQAAVVVPPNLIEPGCTAITPQMLPLIDLEQADIAHIVAHTAGGVANIQDIYQLTALQDGILFHHRLEGQGDPYLLSSIMSFPDRDTLEQFMGAVQTVIARHDILRTAFFWENVSRPAQVVNRTASLPLLEVELDVQDGAIEAQLLERFGPRTRRVDLSCAPLLSYVVAHDRAAGRWVALQLFHHLIGDHSTFALLREEVFALCAGQAASLKPSEPYRNLVAQARLGRSQQEHEAFFREWLGDIDEPTLAFGHADVHQQGSNIDDAHLRFSPQLNQRLRAQARRLGVSLASLCHLAFGQVLARSAGAERVVFGTVLLGRMQSRERASQAAGLFINTLPFRVDLGQASVEAAVRLAHARLAELFEHEHAPLALAQRCSGVAAGSPLFNAILNFRHGVELGGEAALPESGHPLAGVALVASEERSNYPITLSVEDFGQALGVSAQVAQPLSAERMCRYMEQALESLADALEHGPQAPAHTLEILPPDERALLLDTWNGSERPWPRERCLHQLFEEHARRTPQAVAMVDSEQSIDYASLNAQANRLAALLVQRGIARGDHVATLFERGIVLVLAQLAILKAGAIYVPLDPRLVAARREWILDDCGAKLVLADPALATPSAHDTLALPAAEWTQHGLDVPNLELALSGAAAAHVIYTSGSTGTPKGVLVPHRAVSNLAIGNGHTAFDASDRMAFVANPAFDASTIEVWGALLNGARLVVIDTDVLIDAARFEQALTRHGISAMLLTTSLFNQHARSIAPALSRVKYLMSGGERADPEAFRRVLRLGTDCCLLNCYGPAEATVFPLCSRITEADTHSDNLPIGRPIANARAYLLDDHRQPVPLGAAGELYIGGAGVALGYLNRPELTAQRFVPDPFSAAPDARMYKTGDLARYLPGGQLEFLGRNDDQVKIRGFRIEPGEVAAHLMRHPQVHDALVLASGSGAEQRLIAYVIADGTDGADGHALPAALRQQMAASLPDYMLPAAYVRVDAWPLTPNGKLDHKALPAPQDAAFARGAYEAPQGDVEQLIASLWQELLGVAEVGRRDNFFELGGHSLLAVELIERLRRHQLKLDVRRLFAAPVLCTLAAGIERDGALSVPPNLITPGCVAITPEMLPLVVLSQQDIDCIVARVDGGVASIQDIYALAPLQDGILFHHRLGDQGDPYLLSSQRSFPNRELVDRFLGAMQALVERHDILRTAFMWEGLSVPVQVVLRKAALPLCELALDPRDGPIAEQLARRFDPRHERMDLTQAPLLQYALAHDPENKRWLLLQRFHHLIGDHSTLDLLRSELAALMAGKGAALAPAPPFRNLVAQTRLGRSQQEHEQFFRAMLGDVDEPTLPFDVADVQQAGTGVREMSYLLPESLSDQLRQQARRLGVSVASLCHLAWAQVLARVVDRERVVFGTVLFGRIESGEGAARAAGLFINTLPIRLDIGNDDVERAVRQAQERLADLMCHEHASLALAQRCSGVAAPAPLFSSVLNYRHNQVLSADTENADDYRALEQVELLESNERTSYPITLSVDDFGHRLGLSALVVDLLSAERICGYMEQALACLAQALAFAPATPVAALDVLWAKDRPGAAPAGDSADMQAQAPAPAPEFDDIDSELEEFRL